MPEANKLGEILVEQGIISPRIRDRVLKRSHILGRRFGSVLEDLELITGKMKTKKRRSRPSTRVFST